MGKQTTEKLTWKEIIGGEVLLKFLRKQAGMVILIVILTIVYIHNRYLSQKELIKIDMLKEELVEAKYDALSVSSELTEKSRQSRIEEYIATEEAPLEIATAPPFRINVKEKK